MWNYATRLGDRAFCDLCDDRANNEFACRGGSGSIGKHLKIVHLKSPILSERVRWMSKYILITILFSIIRNLVCFVNYLVMY